MEYSEEEARSMVTVHLGGGLGLFSDVAVRIDRAEQPLEGKFYLALVTGPTFPAPSDMALSMDVYEDSRRAG